MTKKQAIQLFQERKVRNGIGCPSLAGQSSHNRLISSIVKGVLVNNVSRSQIYL